MSDPGLPPKPPSLNLLASLVKEEENKETPPTLHTELGSVTKSQEYYDIEKQQIARETSASSFKEFKMKGENIPKANVNSGFKGKKISKPRSSSSDAGTKGRRPFSADYNQQKRNRINNAKPNSRPKSSKGSKTLKGRGSPAQGQRPRSPHAYSSDTSYSSDPEYLKANTSKKDSKYNPDILKKGKTETDSFFDSDVENANETKTNEGDSNILTNGLNLSRRDSKSPDYSRTYGSKDNRSNETENTGTDSREYKRDSSTSDTYTSDEDDSRGRDNKKKENTNGHFPHNRKQGKSETNYVNKNGGHRNTGDSDEKMVVVEDYSSSFTSSDEEEPQPAVKQETSKPKPEKEPLLKRKKKQGLKVFHMSPDQYLETKLHQKYCELEELINCSFVDQKTHVTRYHLYQMELLNNQYQSVSHGRPSSAVIIPRSLPGDVRKRNSRPGSAKRPSSAKMYYHREGEMETNDNAYGTLRSVMAAEHARKTNKIRTDINADRPPSGKRLTKKKATKIEAKLRTHVSDEEEDLSEKPSVGSRGSSKDSSRSLSQHDTPRSGPHIDHHIKYTDNEKLKKWLKEKDKLYRKQIKEEKQKKRQEREKLITEANEKLERHIKSKKEVKKWMHEKDKDLRKRLKEQDEKNERDLEHLRKLQVNLPGDAMRIRPQSAPSTGRSESDESLKGEKTPIYVKNQIHLKREIEEENKQARKAVKTDPHPPQTKFIYKRPVAGKIKLRMEVRGKSPVARETETEKKDEEERSKEMRLSYDDWLKKKRRDDATKKSMKDAERKKELAKSDPELDRMIPDIAKKRIEEKLNSKKRVNTGIKKFDDRANRSFGGADFSGEIEARPKSPYRLEGENRQTKRPSTAPASRGRVPHPTKSASSPRKAIIPQKVDKIMSNNDQSNPYTVPFPPEKGVPKHVASRQKRIFADRITDNLNEIEQRALMNSELIKEGLSDYVEGYDFSEQSANENVQSEQEEKDQRPKITDLMYSPRRREDSSESSDNEIKPDEKVTNILDDNEQKTALSDAKKNDDQAQNENNKDDLLGTVGTQNIKEDSEGDTAKVLEEIKDNDDFENKQPENVEKSMYRSFDNLNELTMSENKATVEHFDQNFSNDKTETDVSQEHTDSMDSDLSDKINEDSVDRVKDRDTAKIEVITDIDDSQNLVSILKESKKSEELPQPEASEEPVQKVQTNDDDELLSPRGEADSPNRKRVSFNEKTEVFQSFESSTTSTDTVTPEPAEFNTDWESLESYPDEPNGEEEEKLSFNIAGFELNPVIIDGEEKKKGGQINEINQTFITDNSTA